MATFVDTSGILALLDSSEIRHGAAWQAWGHLIDSDEELHTSSFVLVESYALIQARLGLEAVRTLHEELLPLLTIHWVDDGLFAESAAALLVADRRRLSLVDCVSFVVMRRLGVRSAFALDSHFNEQGFETSIQPDLRQP